MLTFADNLTWTDKLAFAAATVVAVMLGIGGFSALRFRFSRRRMQETVVPDSDEPLVYPDEGLLSILPFLAFNVLVVFLALYVPWPLWLRLVIAFPFLFMGAFCFFFACVLIAHRLRARRGSRSSGHKQ